jgi:REP element-mobilizing transposase RayT
LPHFDSEHVVQHVTFHLADSLPATALSKMRNLVQTIPAERRQAELRIRIEAWMDAGHGCCILAQDAAGYLVQDTLLTFDGTRYHLLAWVVMPNHVHALLQPKPGWPLPHIMSSWKSFTGRRLAPLMTKATGTLVKHVWHREYWDRFIRDRNHLTIATEYIHNNPVKAGLVKHAADWPWSSARLVKQD